MRQRFLRNATACPCRRKTPPDAVNLATLVFAAAMVSAGEADVWQRRQPVVSSERAARRAAGDWPATGCKTLSSIFLMLPQYAGPALRVRRLQRSAAATDGGGAAGGYRAIASADTARPYRRRAARGDAVIFKQRRARH